MSFPCPPLLPLLAICLFPLSILCASAADDSPASRLADLRERIEKTSRLVAEADGYPAKAGRIDVQVAAWFADYIEWELANPEITKDALMGDRIFHPDGPDEAGPHFRPEEIDLERVPARKWSVHEEAARRYRQHIERELDGSLALIDRAAARLQEARDWPELREPDWSRMTFADGFFRTGGQAAFPAGFNMMLQGLVDLSKHPGYADESQRRLDAFHKEMREIGVGVVSHGMSIPDFLSPDGGIRQDLLNRQVEEIERLTAKGFKVSVLLHWGGDAAVLEKRWPGITLFRGNGVGLDIDHPGSRELVREVGEGIFPVLGKLPGIVAWDMANEPFFDMNQWSPHGLRSYHLWLAERHGSIERLNQRWRTEFKNFAEIRSPKDRPRDQCSTGEWYDQVRFHNHRVTSFFGFVSEEIHRHVPGTLVHMKSQDNSSLGPMPAAVAHGIDREGLTTFCQLQGLDTRPLPVTEPRMAASDYDGSPYALHWLGQSFTFDFLTSLPPRCPVIDLEYHAFSINAIRVPDLSADHGRVALWLAHLHGMVGNEAWYWHRRWGPDPFPAEYFKWWFRDSLSTQPLAAAGYFQTMLELNAVAPEVERLATAPVRPLRLLVSMPSYINDQAHIDALHRVYEGSCFHGLPVGFVTGDMLARDGVPDDCRMLVIPNVDRLSAGALAALATAGRNGVRLMSYGKRLPLLDSYGIPHPDKATAFLKQIPEIAAGAAEELAQRMIEALAPLTKERPLRVERTDTPGAFGVMHRSVETGEDILVLLVNVLNRPLTVRLTARDGSLPRGQDIINGEAVDGHRIDLPVRGVRLVRVQGIPGGTSSIQLVGPADRSVTYATPHGIVGGWHASSDVRKIMRILQPGLEGLLDLKRIADPPWDTGTESILDEIKWGNRYIHAMQLGSGALAQHQFLWCGATDWGESLNRYTNNQPGDADDRVLPEDSLVIDMVSQSRFIKNQTTIHRLYRDIDPEYARLCLEAATRCYDYFHKTWPVVTDYETTFCARPFMEPVTDLMPLAYGVRANLSMHLATGEPEYRQRAVDLADKIMALQEARHIADQDEVRGFFYRDSERSEIFDSQMAHGGLDGAEGAVNVIAYLCENLPNHPHRPRWLECLRLYLVDYLLVLSQKNDFGIVPAYLSLSDHAGGQTGAKMTRRIGGLHYQYLCDNRGANKALARKAILLARGARLLDHPGLRQAAWRQIDWILGCNPMNRSTVYGVGQRQPVLYKTSLEPGSDGMVVQGIGGGGRDMPYLREGHWRWCEMELHHTAWFAQAVLELLAPAD